MILGFLGKGGSGKSSVATQMALFMHAQGKTVLAVDADHNMDLTYNLSGVTSPTMSYLADSLDDMKYYLGVKTIEKYDQIFLNENKTLFSITKPDPVTQKYATLIKPNLYLMAAGPQTDIVLHGQSCSHILTTPLKVYLPLLSLNDTEAVVVDEKAGADGVTTGIVTGIDVGIIVVEPAIHSVKTALQIAELMAFYDTPCLFVGNKITSTADELFLTNALGTAPVTFLGTSDVVSKTPSHRESHWSKALQNIQTVAATCNQNNRLVRTKEKFKRNQAFQTK